MVSMKCISGAKVSKKRVKPRKGTGKNEEVKPNNNNNNYITATQVFSSKNKKLCMDARASVVVYKSHASTDTSGYYQYAFQDAGASPETDVNIYSWTFSDGNAKFQYFSKTVHVLYVLCILRSKM